MPCPNHARFAMDYFVDLFDVSGIRILELYPSLGELVGVLSSGSFEISGSKNGTLLFNIN